MSAIRCLLMATLLPIVLLTSGCQNSPYVPVQGRVTLDGEPLPRGVVQFVPVGTEGPTAAGVIGADGSYTLRTDDQLGAVVGRHRVRIDARAVPKDETDTLPASLIPEIYLSETTSGLEVEVVAGKGNTIDLPLKSQ